MATNSYTGNAVPVAQVTTVQITGFDATTLYQLTINGVTVETLGVTSSSDTATALAAAWEASTHPYFSSVAAVASTDTVTLTGPEQMPFTVASSVSGGAGTIGAATESSGAGGSYNWNDADNWTNGVPVDTDDVYIDKPDSLLLWGLDQTGVTLSSLTVRNNVVIGLPSDRVATIGDASSTSQAADEYRDDYLLIEATTVRIGEHLQPGPVNGTRRLKISNLITTASTTTVFNTGSNSLETDLPAVRLLFADANADLFVRKAQAGVGVAIDSGGESSTMGDIVVSDETIISSVFIGEGVTLSSFVQFGGDNIVSAAADFAAITVNGGKLRTEGSYTVTLFTVTAGSLKVNHTGTPLATTLTQTGGDVDFNGSGKAQAVTTYNFTLGTRKTSDLLTITTDNRSGRITEQVI